MSELNSASIAGAGTIGGGEYSSVRVSGSGKVTGDIKCESFSASGSAHVLGKIDCSGTVSCAGACSFDGDIICDKFSCAGSAKTKSVKAKVFKIAGSTKCMGSVNADEISVAGSSKICGDLTGEIVKIRGSIVTEGLVSGDTVDIEFESQCVIPEIGGENISVRPRSNGNGWKIDFFGIHIVSNESGAAGGAEIGSVEGDEINLESVKAEIVRGSKVTIGKGCRIKRVEYSESIVIDEKATVEEQVKI